MTARRRAGPCVLLAPVIAYLLLCYAIPVSRLLVLGVWDQGPTLGPILRALQEAQTLAVLWTTLQVAAMATCLTVLLAYPVAATLARLRGRALALGMLFVVFPLLTSVLVRTYAWIALLGREGLINQMLMASGLISQPLHRLFNRIGVQIGLVHVLLPMAVLPIYGAIKAIDPRLLRAAASLGASPIVTFATVYLPLSLPGVMAGGLLAFIAASGSYITPIILGGDHDLMLAGLIGRQVEEALDWRMAAALSVLMLGASTLLLALHFRIAGPRGALGGHG